MTLTGKETFRKAQKELARRGVLLEVIHPSGMYSVATIADGRRVVTRTDDLEDAILTGKDLGNMMEVGK